MVVREIRDNPDEILKNFDWFNDYKDTRDYIRHYDLGILRRLDDGYKNWVSAKNREFKEGRKYGL